MSLFFIPRAALLALVLVSSAIASMGAQAAEPAIAMLKRFVADTARATGTFEQTVSANAGRKPQHSSGRFAFERPGRFRWVYEKPFPTLLVSDGEVLWLWDEELNQATVRPLGNALGNTPAAILAGEGEMERGFTLSEAGEADGLSWVLALPRQADSGFEEMRLGFADGTLRRMEMRDPFGQHTVIVFNEMQPNASIDAQQFRFDPPAGADVIRGE